MPIEVSPISNLLTILSVSQHKLNSGIDITQENCISRESIISDKSSQNEWLPTLRILYSWSSIKYFCFSLLASLLTFSWSHLAILINLCSSSGGPHHEYQSPMETWCLFFSTHACIYPRFYNLCDFLTTMDKHEETRNAKRVSMPRSYKTLVTNFKKQFSSSMKLYQAQ